MRLSLEFALQSGHTIFSGFLLRYISELLATHLWWIEEIQATQSLKHRIYILSGCKTQYQRCLAQT